MATVHDTSTSTTSPRMSELIAEGLDATGILPPYEHLAELDKALRAELTRLVPIVQRHVDTLWRGAPDWYTQRSVLDGARDALESDLGTGLRSAATRVHQLARYCHWLAQAAGEVS
ncbi:DUF6415 family natural product biosynthesis protein [Streptomyces sp. O3]